MNPAPHQLDVATPERVALNLPVAGIGYRSIAYLLDLLLIFSAWAVAYFIFTFAVEDVLGTFQGWPAWVQVAVGLGAFFTQWMYWTVCEVAMRGQTPGKRIMKVRVVRSDGASVGLLESAVRNLCRVIDFLPLFYAVGLLSLLLTRPHRRVGDLLAGTLLIRDEAIDLDKYTAGPILDALPVSAAPAPAPAIAGHSLPPDEVELILAYLARVDTLLPEARSRLGARLVRRYGGDLSAEAREATLASAEATELFLRQRARG